MEKYDTAFQEAAVHLLEEMAAGPDNRLGDGSDERAWDDPLVGIAAGNDPLFAEYKKVVGPDHWTPSEVFDAALPGVSVEPENLSVIVWAMPQTAATRAESRKETAYPSRHWSHSRIFGDAFIVEMRKALIGLAEEHGIRAVAPYLLTTYKVDREGPFVYQPSWSERHAGYAAGLGTFGLCDGLITARGKAMRLGSVVVEARLEPTLRSYTGPHDYCLYFTKGTCGVCARRCPVGAISKEGGHDKLVCRDKTFGVKDYIREQYGIEAYGCGLCQTGVPCEAGIPVKNARPVT